MTTSRLDGMTAAVVGGGALGETIEDCLRRSGAAPWLKTPSPATPTEPADILVFVAATAVDFAEAVAVGLEAAFTHARSVLGPMRRRGHGAIVFCATRQPAAGDCPIAAGIAGGLATLARSIAYQYGADGIRVNVVLPGVLASDADIAAAILLLASPDAVFMTGTCLPIGQPEPSRWPG